MDRLIQGGQADGMCAPRGRMKAPSVQASGSLAERKERVAFHKSRARDHLLPGVGCLIATRLPSFLQKSR